MNKLEAIKRVEQMGEYERFVDEPISKLSVFNILNQLDEPEKVKIPQFVAQYIKWTKGENLHLLSVIDRRNFNQTLDDWFITDYNTELFARAWFDGYEVEKEPKYTVKVKAINCATKYLVFGEISGSWFFAESRYGNLLTKFTREELEEAGFGWIFSCEGIELEEVTE